MRHDRGESAGAAVPIGRRAILRGAMATAGVLGLGAFVPRQTEAQRGAGPSTAPRADSTLALARFLNNTAYRDSSAEGDRAREDDPRQHVRERGGRIVIDSARILRQLAKEQGGKPEATIWFDGTKIPASEAARVNAMLSDAAASDDSDIRNTAHEGTTLVAVGLAIGERTGATGQDLLGAMILGYEAAGRIGEARTRRARRPSRVADRRIRRRHGCGEAPEAHRRADGARARDRCHHHGWPGHRDEHLGPGVHGRQRGGLRCQAALAASRGYTVNEDMLGSRGGFVDVFGGGAKTVDRLTADLGKEWDIVDFLAIKLWPGAHPFSGTVEAAMNAARAGKRRTRRRGEDPRGRAEPDEHSGQPAADQSGRRHSQPVVLRRVGRRGQGLHLGACDRGEVLAIRRSPGSWIWWTSIRRRHR